MIFPSSNNHWLQGSLAFDPQLRETRKGYPVTSNVILCPRRIHRDGEMKAVKDHVSVVFWGDQARRVASSRRGDWIRLMGRGRRSWRLEESGRKVFFQETCCTHLLAIHPHDESAEDSAAFEGENSHFLQGTLALASELRHTQQGQAVTSNVLHCERVVKPRDGGATQHYMDEISLVFWGEHAAAISKLDRGAFIRLVGRVQQSWRPDEYGKKAYYQETCCTHLLGLHESERAVGSPLWSGSGAPSRPLETVGQHG